MIQPDTLPDRIRACRICAGDFARADPPVAPRPVVWFGRRARILIAGQAPGTRVYRSGIPFDDASGKRLREWLAMDRETFYDRNRIAIVPMAFCFPGLRNGADLPPPGVCAGTWRAEVMGYAGPFDLTLLVGGYAQKYHLGDAASGGVGATVAAWRDLAPDVFPLPHPSWRNTRWLKDNPWFAAELLPALRARVTEVLR
ncbi:uracil-DNA glycosylase family protein [Tropicimonas sp.]|uniref:uracil-DNA glycosylase family protein n=1 Tax=Tropicimonas sp. TaxID=2067044 RepID=UPI003A840C72